MKQSKTTRKDMSERELQVPDKNVHRFAARITSGSTSGVPIVHINHIARYANPAYAPLKRFAVGYGQVNAEVSHALSILRSYNPGDVSRKVLCLFGTDLTPELARLLPEFDPECVRGSPSYLFALLEQLGGAARSLHPSVLAYSAEILSLQKRKILADLFPSAKLLSVYSAADFGPIGEVPCGLLPPNTYHPYKGVTIEIQNPDEQGVGELLVSKEGVPRYAIGDAARILSERCACGDPVSFELVGRVNFDYIKLAGATLRIEEFERVARELQGYIADYRAVAQEEVDGVHVRGKIMMRIIPTPALQARERSEEFIAREISRRLFLTPSRTLAELAGDYFSPLEVSFARQFPPERKVLRLRFDREGSTR